MSKKKIKSIATPEHMQCMRASEIYQPEGHKFVEYKINGDTLSLVYEADDKNSFRTLVILGWRGIKLEE